MNLPKKRPLTDEEFKAFALKALNRKGFGKPEVFITETTLGARGTKKGKQYEVSFVRGTYEDMSRHQVIQAIENWGTS